MLIFNIKEIPTLNKSGGVLLQKIKNGFISDIISFDKNKGLEWNIGKQQRSLTDISLWIGKRAQVGKKIPKKFNKSLKF